MNAQEYLQYKARLKEIEAAYKLAPLMLFWGVVLGGVFGFILARVT